MNVSSPRAMFLVMTAAIPLALPAPARADRVTVSPPPAWVVPVATSAGAGDPHPGGATYLELLDYQQNETVTPPEYYAHVALRVLNEQGVTEASQVSVDFDPSYQTLALHRVTVRRGGQSFDRLKRSSVKVIQRERRLEYQIYDGRLTALLLLEDVRAGDVLEYSYTIRGVNPVMAGDCDQMDRMGSDRPIGRYEVRLVWDSSRPLEIRKLGRGSIADPRMEDLGRCRRYVWAIAPMPITEIEDDLPAGFDPLPSIQLTSIRSWADVSSWGSRLFSAAPGSSTALRERVAAIRATASTPEAAALAAIRFVEDDVRYLGVELGMGSYRPTDPGRVLERRFGDCKDKALLLVTLLRALGWRADPALVSSTYAGEVRRFAPSRHVFDHVIVHVERDGRAYWIDPTLQGQRGNTLDQIYVPPYGYGLILRPGVAGLESVTSGAESQYLLTIEKTFEAPDCRAPASLRVVSTYRGAAAENMRVGLRAGTVRDLAKNYLEFYQHTYPGIQAVDSVEFADNEDLNQVTTVERYSIPGFWKRLSKQARFTADLKPVEFLGRIPASPMPNRTLPLRIDLPRHMVVSSHLHLAREWSTPPDDKTIENPGFRFKSRSWGEGSMLHLEYELERLRDALPAESVSVYAKDLDSLDQAMAFAALSGVDVAPGESSVNWMAVCVLLIVLGGATLGARVTYRYRPEPGATAGSLTVTDSFTPADPLTPAISFTGAESPTREDFLAPGADEAMAEGKSETPPPAGSGQPIGGWLSLLGIGVALTPVYLLANSIDSFRILEGAYWSAAIRPDGSMNPGLASLLILEACVNVVLIVASLLVLVMFAQRRRLFPRIWILFGVFSTCVVVLDLSLATAMGGASATPGPKGMAMVIRSVVATVIWGSYLLRSRRVRETFVL